MGFSPRNRSTPLCPQACRVATQEPGHASTARLNACMGQGSFVATRRHALGTGLCPHFRGLKPTATVRCRYATNRPPAPLMRQHFMEDLPRGSVDANNLCSAIARQAQTAA